MSHELPNDLTVKIFGSYRELNKYRNCLEKSTQKVVTKYTFLLMFNFTSFLYFVKNIVLGVLSIIQFLVLTCLTLL